VRTRPLFILFITLLPVVIKAASLDPATLKAWDEYVESANSRMEQRLSPGNVFLIGSEQGEGRGIILAGLQHHRDAEREGRVYVEFETIGMSRDIPASLRWIVEPVVRRTSRASLSTSLRQTETAVRSHAVNATANTPEAAIAR
jgi:hypothetical protein